MVPTPKQRQGYFNLAPSKDPSPSGGVSISSPSQLYAGNGASAGDDYLLARNFDNEHGGHARSRSRRTQRCLVGVAGGVVVSFLVVTAIVRSGKPLPIQPAHWGGDSSREGSGEGSGGGGHSRWSDWEMPHLAWGGPAPVVSHEALDGQECNPFKQHGYLSFNETDAMQSRWRPYGGGGTGCSSPPSLFAQLRDDLQRILQSPSSTQRRAPSRPPPSSNDPSTLALPWLYNRTVVLLGDSIDRFHLRDFCDLTSATLSPPFHGISSGGGDPSVSVPGAPSQSYFVDPNDPASPPVGLGPGKPGSSADLPEPGWPLTEEGNRTWADLWTSQWTAGKKELLTVPWVCHVEHYNLLFVNIFTFGLEPPNGGKDLSGFRWYYPPAKARDRLHHILVPLLAGLARVLDRPQTVSPDLVEVSSMLWDLRQFSDADFTLAGMAPNEESQIPHLPLSDDRVGWWSAKVEELLDDVASTFAGGEGPGAPPPPPLLWRSAHPPQRHFWAPFARVQQLDQAARYVVEKVKGKGGRARGWADRLRIDEWGARMAGQESHFRDLLHPDANPGSVLWGDIILWELRRAVRGSKSLDEVLDK